jgi:hypothetical protein
MEFEHIASGPVTIVEARSPLTSIDDAMDLIGACMEHDTDRLLLDSAVLPEAFFELHTRFAGELLQKLQNYRFRTAVVISPDRNYGERFNEFLVEAKRAPFSRLFTSREEAIAWLSEK